MAYLIIPVVKIQKYNAVYKNFQINFLQTNYHAVSSTGRQSFIRYYEYWVLFQDNWSALLCAAKEGYADICMELLEHGADIEHRDMVWYFYEVSDFICFLFCKW